MILMLIKHKKTSILNRNESIGMYTVGKISQVWHVQTIDITTDSNTEHPGKADS